MRDQPAEALEHARRAYVFSPGSYTFGAFTAVVHAVKACDALQATWVTEFLEYAEASNPQPTGAGADDVKPTRTEMRTEP